MRSNFSSRASEHVSAQLQPHTLTPEKETNLHVSHFYLKLSSHPPNLKKNDNIFDREVDSVWGLGTLQACAVNSTGAMVPPFLFEEGSSLSRIHPLTLCAHALVPPLIWFEFSVSLLRVFDPGYAEEFGTSPHSLATLSPPSPPPLSPSTPPLPQQQQRPSSSHHSRSSPAGGVQLRIKNR